MAETLKEMQKISSHIGVRRFTFTCNLAPIGRSRSENVIRMYPGCSPDIVSIVNEKEEQQEEGNPGELTSPMWFIDVNNRL